MPQTAQFTYWQAFIRWLGISLLFIGATVIPLIGIIAFPIGVIGVLTSPFAKWLIFKTECPHCGDHYLQEFWKTAYKCRRCKQRVFIQKKDGQTFTTTKP